MDIGVWDDQGEGGAVEEEPLNGVGEKEQHPQSSWPTTNIWEKFIQQVPQHQDQLHHHFLLPQPPLPAVVIRPSVSDSFSTRHNNPSLTACDVTSEGERERFSDIKQVVAMLLNIHY